MRASLPAWPLLATALLLAGCGGGTSPRPDTSPPALTPRELRQEAVHVPDFAIKPFEPFSRIDTVAITLREWRLWGSPVNDDPPTAQGLYQGDAKPERQPGLWQRVGEYWWIGQNADSRTSSWTGKHAEFGNVFDAASDEDYAWSAAFISYVMRIAGAGLKFPYAPSHATYINVAAKMARGTAEGWDVIARPIEAYAPQPGDLICYGRRGAQNLQFRDLPSGSYASHCDLVTGTTPRGLAVIGGNVDDSVTMKHIPIDADGRIGGPTGVPYDTRYPWVAVLQVQYDQ